MVAEIRSVVFLSIVEWELLTLLDHQISPAMCEVRVAHYVVFCLVLNNVCILLYFFSFSVGHCCFRPSLIWSFSQHLWCFPTFREEYFKISSDILHDKFSDDFIELLYLINHIGLLVGSLLLIFVVFCVVTLVLLVFVLCLVSIVPSVSGLSIHDSPFGFL